MADVIRSVVPFKDDIWETFVHPYIKNFFFSSHFYFQIVSFYCKLYWLFSVKKTNKKKTFKECIDQGKQEPDSCVGPKACAMLLAVLAPLSTSRGATSLCHVTTRWHCESTRDQWSLYILSSWSSQTNFHCSLQRVSRKSHFCQLNSFIIHAGKVHSERFYDFL